MKLLVGFLFLILLGPHNPALAQQHSVARQWSEVLLSAIRTDFARPTGFSLNLMFHAASVYP
jgi:hypothetical protein